MDGYVRISDERGQIVDHVAGADALVAPVPRQADVMHYPVSLEPEWPDAPRYQCLRLDAAARRRDAHPVRVLDADFLRVLRRDFAEQLRHQLRQPRQPA